MRRLGRNLKITKNNRVLKSSEPSCDATPRFVDENDEGNGGEENVEREGTGEKGDVVFVGRLEGSPDDAGDRAVPAAFTIHASGSSSSSDAGGGTGGRARARRRRAASSRRRSCSRVAISGSSASSDSSD